MDNSILNNVKKLLGLDADYTAFDTDIVIHINTVFSNLTSMGIGPTEGFKIFDNSATWDEYLQDKPKLDNIKTYMYLKVRLLFDPPQNSTLLESWNREIKEMEYRMYTEEGGY